MANKLQKMLYVSGILAPVVIVYELIEICQHSFIVVDVVSFLVAVLLVVYHVKFIKTLVIDKLVLTTIMQPSVPKAQDNKVILVVVSYLTPLCKMLIANNNTSCFIPIIILIVIVLSKINNNIPSPIYYLLGFHYYSIDIGGQTCLLISKKSNYRNANNVKQVREIFDQLLIIQDE